MKLRVRIDGEEHEVEMAPGALVVDGRRYRPRVSGTAPRFEVVLGARTFHVRLTAEGFAVDGETLPVRVEALAPAAARVRHHAHVGPVHPPLPGRVAAVRVKEGDKVKAGQCLVVLEAMKMQNEVPAPSDGTVKQVKVREGQLVDARDVLVVLG